MKEEGKVISRLFVEKKGKMIEVVIRFPKRDDANGVWKFFEKAKKETTYLGLYKPAKLKDEESWVKNMMKDSKEKNSVYLLAEHDNKIIGSVTINREKGDVKRHVGRYGIVILQEYTGMGLGRKLSEMAIEMTKNELKLEILTLSVYHHNKIAQGLYRKLGFRILGTLPKGVKRGNRYFDDIIMYKILK